MEIWNQRKLEIPHLKGSSVSANFGSISVKKWSSSRFSFNSAVLKPHNWYYHCFYLSCEAENKCYLENSIRIFGVKDWSNLGHKCKPTSKLMVAIVRLLCHYCKRFFTRPNGHYRFKCLNI